MITTTISYGQIEKKLSDAGIKFTTTIDVKYTNSKEHRVIRCVEVYCNKIVQDLMMKEIKKVLSEYLDEVEIINDNHSIYLKIK